LLAAFGLPVPRTLIAATREAAIQAAEEIGFPAVMKIHSPDITHKSDVGGVRLSLQNAAMVASASDDMMRHVKAIRPDARITGVAVQPMLSYAHAREVLVGVATDAVFGPVISFGAGGVSVASPMDASCMPGPPASSPSTPPPSAPSRAEPLSASGSARTSLSCISAST
jgi:acetyltransferase